MSMEIIPDETLKTIAGGTDVTLPPGFRGPWLPIVPRPRPWPPRFGIDPIPASPRLVPSKN